MAYHDVKTQIETVRAEKSDDKEIVDLCNAMLEMNANHRDFLMLMAELGLDADDSDRIFAVLESGIRANAEFHRTKEAVRNKFGYGESWGEIS